ncbi:MAG: hypothetical protein B6A08_05415 [Sorangiineae bacterium NIC37A_2]|jgi:serine protein kinase|nr:MAG: hypothetical protein B6A08_05415 [Sorangiineae bacterium NIC37A_2]
MRKADQALSEIDQRLRRAFEAERRVLSFAEYLELVESDPEKHTRDASQYLLDMIRSFGSYSIERPAGPLTRYRVFDQEFLGADAVRENLIGHEEVQGELVRSLHNFVRIGRASRLLLLHGPNGSAKSTLAACLMRGLEHYSMTDEGALYRVSWVFPKKALGRGAIGFGGRPSEGQLLSYAHLSDDDIEARVSVEVRDHPLFLLPPPERQKLLEGWLPPNAQLSRYLTHGTLCHKSKRIFDALLLEGNGSIEHVLKHVRIERFFISRRYRVGAVTLGPELSVDARERQVTADQNLGALPLSLRSLSLYEVSGELVDAHGGLLELSDLLKRPLDAFKYLQTVIETGEVALSSQTLLVNSTWLGSANELHLAAFREHPEFESFRGRFELIPVPYLLDYRDEELVYSARVGKQMRIPIAPHTFGLAARFAVLTRLKRPNPQAYEEEYRAGIQELSAWQKMELYAGRALPPEQAPDKKRSVRHPLPPTKELHEEFRAHREYEGSFGASPREMTTLLFDAAQDHRFSYLSPFAVLDQIDRLCERVDDYSFLRIDAEGPGYHDTRRARSDLRSWLLDQLEDELRQVSGIVDDVSYQELLSRYFEHVGAQAKGEKLRNPLTGALEEPDENRMGEVERLLGAEEPKEDFRGRLMGRIAAWALEHPGQPLVTSPVFASLLAQLRSAVFAEKRQELGKICEALREETPPKDTALRKAVDTARAGLMQRFGYTEAAVRDTAAYLFAERFS